MVLPLSHQAEADGGQVKPFRGRHLLLGAPAAAALRSSEEGLPVRLDAHRAEGLAWDIVLRGDAGVPEASAPGGLSQGALGVQPGQGEVLLVLLPQPGQGAAVVLLQSSAGVRQGGGPPCDGGPSLTVQCC